MSFKVKDHYFNKAKKENFFARSVYKLEEIDQKFKVLKKSDYVVDFGYSPGSWVQYTTKVVGEYGQVIGIDINHDIVPDIVKAHKKITLITGDACESFNKVRVILIIEND